MKMTDKSLSRLNKERKEIQRLTDIIRGGGRLWTEQQIEYAVDLVEGDDGTTSEQVLDVLQSGMINNG
tara:strand:- start:267 stop:470 length:204 start_codon:yes stop_codon:yes gene_type:complete